MKPCRRGSLTENVNHSSVTTVHNSVTQPTLRLRSKQTDRVLGNASSLVAQPLAVKDMDELEDGRRTVRPVL